MSTAYEMPAENRVSRFRSAICAALRALCGSTLFRLRFNSVLERPRGRAICRGIFVGKICTLCGVCVYGGWMILLENLAGGNWNPHIGILSVSVFSPTPSILCLLILVTFRECFFLSWNFGKIVNNWW